MMVFTRRGWLTVLNFSVVAAGLTLGALLILTGATTVKAHPEPLPAHQFAITPAQARALPTGTASTIPTVKPSVGTKPGATSTSHHPGPCSTDTSAMRISVPSLCIDAPVLTEDMVHGSFQIPDDVRKVGLDRDSAPLDSPVGTTIVAGHVDDANQGQGSFYPLTRAQPGAVIVVVDSAGRQTRWRVFRIASYSKTALPITIFDTTGPRQLVLVTCGGKLLYQPGYGHTYADNVLVYATPA